ncbi:MAG TPA: polymer-forming cytoskeletal protein, partial [Burkholderiaceae bacterium]|nr:polymer-forming cytoskeletal protein [Burkholderiaceae bacterium]
MFGKNQGGQKAIETLIGAKTRMIGNVEFAGGLRVDGMVKGELRAQDDQPSFLVISELATIEGGVTAAHVVVNGTVQG